MEEQVSFKSGRNTLHGVLHIPSKGSVPYPAVIMCHGFTGCKSESHFIFTRAARIMAKNGVGTLRFDFAGSGDSEGKFENMSMETRSRDAKKALDFVSEHRTFDKNRIGMLGISMGAITASLTASTYRLRALALWSPIALPEKIGDIILTPELKTVLSAKGEVHIPGMGQKLGKNFFNSTVSAKPLEYASLYGGYVLVIHAKDDKTVSLDNSFSYFEAFHKNALFPRMMVLDEGGHTFSTELSEKEAITETSDFFKSTLTPEALSC